MNWWAICSLSSVAVLIALNTCLLLRPPPYKPLATAVRLGLFSHLVFAIGDFCTYVASTPRGYEAAVMVLYSGVLLVGPTWWLMSLRYAESLGKPFRFATPLWTSAPFAVAAVLAVALATNPYHQQFFTAIQGARNTYHWLWWVNTTFSYGLGLITVGLYLRLAGQVVIASQRARIYFMMSAALLVLISSVSYVGLSLPFDPTAAAFSLCGALYLAGLYQTGHFSLSRVAIGNILDQQPAGLLVSDLGGALIYWNPAAEEILQTNVGRISSSVEHWLAQQLQPGDAQQPTVIGHPSGTALEYRLRSNPRRVISVRVEDVLSSRGQPRGHCFLLEDTTAQHQQVSERAKLQEQVARAQKLEGLGVLAGGIAHDFNNLLQAIRGNTELALSDLAAGLDPTDRLRNLDQASLRATELTHHLLTYAGKAPSKPTRVSLAPLITKAVELLHTTVLHNKTELQLELADDTWLNGDDVQLEQVVMNLVLNAAEASPANSIIQIHTGTSDLRTEDLAACQHSSESNPGKYVWLSVEDRGRGISDANIDRMFDPFYSTKTESHGLGLAAVLGIVRKHSGAVKVSSNIDSTQGATGTSVRVYLPAVQQSQPAGDTNLVNDRDRRHGYVLVIDDEHIVREVACRFLRNSGYLVLEADSGEQALAMLNQLTDRVALTLADVVMPGMSGPDTVAKLRQTDPDLPAIYMSGHPRGHLDELLGPDNNADYLAKPFTKQDLLSAVALHCLPTANHNRTSAVRQD